MFYVYMYRDPDTNLPFYIGKGKGKRAYDHLKSYGVSKRMRDKITSLKLKNSSPIIEIINENLTEQNAYDIEKDLIKQYGRKGLDPNGILMNISLGDQPPIYKNNLMITGIYSNKALSLELSTQLLEEVLFFLNDFNGNKKYNNLLKCEIGYNFIAATKYMPMSYTVPQRLWHIKNGPHTPACKNCMSSVSFKQFPDGEYRYCEYCSSTCRNKHLRNTGQRRSDEFKEKMSEIVKKQYESNSRRNVFLENNPMLCAEYKQSWRKSRCKK